MLSESEIVQVIQALMVTAEAMGDTLSAPAAAIMATDLEEYPLDVVLKSLKQVRREVKGRLALNDILKRVEAADGHPDANEAWALAIGADDESATVVWTDEIAQAFSAARPLLAERDKVGARMAFIAAYERHLKAARDAKKPAHWSASLGHDPAQREVALRTAVESGCLLPARITHLLPPPELTEGGSAIAGLLTGPTESIKRVPAPPHVIEQLEKIARDMRDKDRRDREERDRIAAEERAEFERRRKQAVEALENHPLAKQEVCQP